MCMINPHRQSLIGTRVSAFYRLLAIVLAGLPATSAAAADQPNPPPRPVLHLANGGTSVGQIRASTRPGVLRWQAAASDSPRDFAWNEVAAIEWPAPAMQVKPAGDFCFELAAGDVMFGTLLALDDHQAELDVPRLGRIHVQRSNLHRIDRWRKGADLIYLVRTAWPGGRSRRARRTGATMPADR